MYIYIHVHGKGEGHVVHAGVNCVCGSAHSCGCMVNGTCARAASLSIIILVQERCFAL